MDVMTLRWSPRIDASWLLVLFTIDMMFLPMFHVGPVPVKPSYVLLTLYVGEALSIRGASRIILCSWGLAIVGVMGGVFLFVIEEHAGFAETARNSFIWVLAPLAFAFGWRHRRSLDFLFVLLPAYVLLNVVVTFGRNRFPGLIAFYGLDPWVATGLFDLRSPGIHFNPNLSALAGNLLFLGIVAGQRAGLISVRSVAARWLVAASGIVLHLMMGSRGEALACVILGILWLYYLNQERGARIARFAGIAVAAALLALAVLVPVVRFLATRYTAVAFVEGQFTSSLTVVTREQIDNPAARINSLILRPFVKAERVADRFARSPLWGTGFDTAATYPFEETYFHDDRAVLLVAGGLIGMGLFVTLLIALGGFGMAMLVPFFLSAPVNSFILAPQHVMFYFAIAGCLARQRPSAAAAAAEADAVHA
jgi:hypothetical protein